MLLSVAMLLAGCRLDLAAETVVEHDGSGTVAVVARLDPQLLDELDALGVDPTAELEAAAAVTDGWDVDRTLEDDASLTVRLSHDVADVGAIGDAYRELAAGLGPDDPALLVDVEVARGADGSVDVGGTATLRPPATAGMTVDGVPVGPDADELGEIVDRAVTAEVVMTLPGRIDAHDGDEIDGQTVTWQMEAGETRPIDAHARPPAWWQQLPLAVVGGGAAAAAVLVALGVWWWRRRVTREA